MAEAIASTRAAKMAYSLDLRSSAERHLRAAEALADPSLRPPCHDVAGYLYGVAAECALKMVPMERSILEDLWRRNDTASRIRDEARARARPSPVQLEEAKDPVVALLSALASIGVMESRSTGKIDVPDIFRVEAGIKRRGGVKPPRRTRAGG
jgi:hypothetical protein